METARDQNVSSIHITEKKFKLCDDKFLLNSELEKHLDDKHSTEKENVCNFCGKTFHLQSERCKFTDAEIHSANSLTVMKKMRRILNVLRMKKALMKLLSLVKINVICVENSLCQKMSTLTM